MPRRQRPSPDAGAPQSPSTKPEVGPSVGQETAQRKRAKTPEEEFEERPDIQFARDFDKDLSFAYQFESALEMETDLELELEQALIDEGNAEPWAARIMRQSWSADPKPRSLDDFQRFRMTPEAFAALQVSDPMEAMLVAQASALHTNMLYMMSEATRLAGLKQNPKLVFGCYTTGIKLSAAHAKLMETLKRYRTKGEQKVSVRYERLDRGTQMPTKLSRSKRERITVSGPGVDVADFTKSPEEESVPITSTGKGTTRG